MAFQLAIFAVCVKEGKHLRVIGFGRGNENNTNSFYLNKIYFIGFHKHKNVYLCHNTIKTPRSVPKYLWRLELSLKNYLFLQHLRKIPEKYLWNL